MIAPIESSVQLRNPGAVQAVSTWDFAGDADGPVVVLAHGAGSRGDHPVHVGVCSAIAATGGPVVAFNFPYAEAGRRSPDRAEKLLDCFRDVAEAVRVRHPGRPIVAGGRSMGGRMASLLAAEGYPFAGLALLNYPLIGIRGGDDKPPRTAHWPDITVPVLFVHGTRDRLLPAELFDAERHRLTAPTTVHVIADADHSFRVPARGGRGQGEIYAEIAAAVRQWLLGLAVTP